MADASDILWVVQDEPLTFRRGSRPDPLHGSRESLPYDDAGKVLRVLAKQAVEPYWSDVLEQVADSIQGIVERAREVSELRRALNDYESELEEANERIEKLELVRSVQFAREQTRRIRELEKEGNKLHQEVNGLEDQIDELGTEASEHARADRYRLLLVRHLGAFVGHAEATHVDLMHVGTFPSCPIRLCTVAQKQVEEWWANAYEFSAYQMSQHEEDNE